MRLKQTPSQTVGPFFAYGLTPAQYGYPFGALVSSVLVDDETPGKRIRIVGRVLDGQGGPVPDAMIEIWQADAEGRYAHPADRRGSNLRFQGFGRCGTGTDPENRFVFETIKPGPIGDGQAPHVNLILFMRGMLCHVYTRIYFDDEAEANARDPVLSSVDEARRHTLIAARQTTPAGPVYRIDLRMQGPDETVFFDV
jgi:protocatechuate 3,4-dioxygenase, alpha subunit